MYVPVQSTNNSALSCINSTHPFGKHIKSTVMDVLSQDYGMKSCYVHSGTSHSLCNVPQLHVTANGLTNAGKTWALPCSSEMSCYAGTNCNSDSTSGRVSWTCQTGTSRIWMWAVRPSRAGWERKCSNVRSIKNYTIRTPAGIKIEWLISHGTLVDKEVATTFSRWTCSNECKPEIQLEMRDVWA